MDVLESLALLEPKLVLEHDFVIYFYVSAKHFNPRRQRSLRY